jgi:hypothetical protein
MRFYLFCGLDNRNQSKLKRAAEKEYAKKLKKVRE